MHMRKAVAAAGQPDLLGFDDARDCQCEQPGAAARDCILQQTGVLAQVVVDGYTLQHVPSGIQTTVPLDSAISSRRCAAALA